MKRRSSEALRQARGFGAAAEAAALLLLLANGYKILARGYLVPGGEIDIVAARGETVAFVEVKARPDLETAASAITAEKRRRIVRAARFWLSRNRAAAAKTLRGDAVFVAPWRLPRHVENAFDLDG